MPEDLAAPVPLSLQYPAPYILAAAPAMKKSQIAVIVKMNPVDNAIWIDH
ncbi:hypothetical protein MPC1_8930003 [Methylocella tundrae]|nr:hypothetical protein MPC1_8930003 [Methylocella tundrae]